MLMNGTARGYAGPPEQAGRAFLKTNKDLFGIEDVRRELKVAKTSRSDDGSSRVQYRQMYRGIPVLNSGYLVALDVAGAVHYVSGDYYPNLQVETTPRVQPRTVVGTMRSDLGGASSFKVRQEPALSIFVDDSGEELITHLAYEARAERRDPLGAYKYVVDAHSGEILQKISLIEDLHRHAEAKAPRSESSQADWVRPNGGFPLISGTGDVYTTNPLREPDHGHAAPAAGRIPSGVVRVRRGH
jgi:Zn-dependent metalloprotease